MTIEGMFSTIVIACINLLFVAIIIYTHIKNPNRYNGIKKWLFANLIGLVGCIIVFLYDNSIYKIESDIAPKIVGVFGYLLMLQSFIVANNGIMQLVNKSPKKILESLIHIIMLIIIFIIGVFVENKIYFILVFVFSLAINYARQIFVVNCNRTKDERSSWLSFTLLQIVALITFIVFFIFDAFIRNVEIMNLLFENGENFIVKGTVILTTFNSLSVITALNNVSPKYANVENTLYRVVFNLTPNVIVIYDPSSLIIQYVNPKFTEITGYTAYEVVKKKKVTDFIKKECSTEAIIVDMGEGAKLKEFQVQFATKNEFDIVGLVAITEIPYNDSNYYLASVTDITNTIEETKKYQQLAKFDELTGLPNRRAIIDSFDKKILTDKKFAVIILDIDDFKVVNDEYGHNMGDEVLKFIAPKLDNFNKNDNLAARYGGDEFVLLISYQTEKDIDKVIRKIIDIFSEKIFIDEHTFKVNVSIGIAKYPFDGINFKTLLEKADESLYRAKDYSGIKAFKYEDIEKKG